jgi:4-carboxymuconolactone decarboxylase
MSAPVSLIEEPLTEELRELYERLSQGGLGLGVLNIFKVLAHSPPLLRNYARFGTTFFTNATALSPRLREIAVLRVGQITGSEYEFAQHVRIALMAGLTVEEIADLQNYDETESFSDLERAVIKYTDAVSSLTPEVPGLARELKRWLSERELMELTFAIGHWNMVARVLVPLEVELDAALVAELPVEWREWM